MAQIRDIIRAAAKELGGKIVIELAQSDIFQFKNQDNLDEFVFSAMAKNGDIVIENGKNFRVGVKYEKANGIC